MRTIKSTLRLVAKILKALNEKQKQEADKAFSRRRNVNFGPMFKQQRTYFPTSFYIDKKHIIKKESDDMIHFIYSLGLELVDYVEGKVKYRDGKKLRKRRDGTIEEIYDTREYNLGPFLAGNKYLKKEFEDRFEWNLHGHFDGLIVISHHPHDIAGMSTDRNWSSCQNLNGNSWYGGSCKVFEMIETGGMVAYLVQKHDKNIEKPLARVSIHRYEKGYEKDQSLYFRASTVTYGVYVEKFQASVQEILDMSNKITSKIGIHDRTDSGYNDDHIEDVFYMDADNQNEIMRIVRKLLKEKKYDKLISNISIFDKLDIGNLKIITREISSTPSIDLMVEFAFKVEGLDLDDIEELQDSVMRSGNVRNMAEFSKHPKADVELLREEIISRGKAEEIYAFAAYGIKDEENIRELEDELIKVDNGGLYIMNFANSIKEADKKKLEDAIIRIDKTGELICKFAIIIKGADIKKLEDAVIRTDKTGEWIYDFAKHVYGADRKKLEDAVINCGNPRFIEYFAFYVEGANKERLFIESNRIRSNIQGSLRKISKVISLIE